MCRIAMTKSVPILSDVCLSLKRSGKYLLEKVIREVVKLR